MPFVFILLHSEKGGGLCGERKQSLRCSERRIQSVLPLTELIFILCGEKQIFRGVKDEYKHVPPFNGEIILSFFLKLSLYRNKNLQNDISGCFILGASSISCLESLKFKVCKLHRHINRTRKGRDGAVS